MTTLKQFYSDFHQKSSDFLGWSLANRLWSLRETQFEQYQEEHFDVLRELDRFIKANVRSEDVHKGGYQGLDSHEKKSPARRGADFGWKISLHESHEVLDLNEWIAHSIELGQLKAEQECGYPDLDLNFETQQVCGVQLEEFHRGTWAMNKVRKLFSEKSFTAIEPVELDLKTHLVNVFATLDKLLQTQVHGGLNHPYKISAGVATLSFVDYREEVPKEYPVLRHFEHTNIPNVLQRLKDDMKDHYSGLMKTIKEQQQHLNNLPDGWPNERVYGLSQEWAQRRYLGDNGLVGSDFFDGIWLNSLGPLEVVADKPLIQNQEESAQPTDGLSFAQLRLRRAQRNEAKVQGARLREGETPSNEKSFRL